MAVQEATSTVVDPAGEGKKLLDLLTSVKRRVEDRLDRLEISRALEEAMDLVFEVRLSTACDGEQRNADIYIVCKANKLLTVLEPWKSTTSPTT